MKSTGAVQVIARDDRERATLPVSGAIIIPLDSMIISPQRAMLRDIHHLNYCDQSADIQRGVSHTLTSQVTNTTFICVLFSVVFSK